VADRPFLAHFGRLVFGLDRGQFGELVSEFSRTTVGELGRAVPAECRAPAGGRTITREWRYEVYRASDPLYAWKTLGAHGPRAARFFREAAARLTRRLGQVRRAVRRNGDILEGFETILLCLETAAVRLEAGDQLRRAYARMDRLAPAKRMRELERCVAALDRVGRDLARHELSERAFSKRTGGDVAAMECMADVHERLALWKRRIRIASKHKRLPALELLLTLRDYRDPYPTTLRRFDTNKTLKTTPT
jgi:hypothetical protein